MGGALSAEQQRPRQKLQPTPSKKAILAKPWRTYKIIQENGWTQEVQNDLLDYISKAIEKQKINIAVLGPVGSGKSSLISSFFTVAENRISVRAQAGIDISSFTMYLQQMKGTGKLENITFYDTMGFNVNDDTGFETKNICAVAKGGIEPGSKLDEEQKVNKEGNKELFQNCIVYVLDGENVKNGLQDDLTKKIVEIKHQLKNIKSGPKRVIILTHIDSVCSEVDNDITRVFVSAAVDESVKRASSLLGIPIGHIFPVKNYVAEQDVDEKLNILLLLALQKIVNFSIDQIEGSKNDNYSALETKVKK